MMEHHNYALFIGHLIPAMTDVAQNPKVFPFALSCGKRAEKPQLACVSKVDLTNIYGLM